MLTRLGPSVAGGLRTRSPSRLLRQDACTLWPTFGPHRGRDMTWDSQGPATPQDPRWGGAYPPPTADGQPAGYQPSGYPPPPPGPMPPPPPGGYPPPGTLHRATAPPPGYMPPPPPPGYAPRGYGPQEPVWQPPPAFPLAPDAFPVNVSYDRQARISRFWGILWIGQLVRGLCSSRTSSCSSASASGRPSCRSSPGSRCSCWVASRAGAIAGSVAC